MAIMPPSVSFHFFPGGLGSSGSGSMTSCPAPLSTGCLLVPQSRRYDTALSIVVDRVYGTTSFAGISLTLVRSSRTSTSAGQGVRDVAALRPFLVAGLAAGVTGGPGRFVLAVTATAREAEDLTAALRAFLPPDSVATFPGWETLPHERLSPRSDTVGQRIAVLIEIGYARVARLLKECIPPAAMFRRSATAGLRSRRSK
jgi:hypothetical protein